MLEVAALERERLAVTEEIRRWHEEARRERADLRERLGAGVSVDLRQAGRQAHAGLQLMGRAHRAAVRLAGVGARLDRARARLGEATARRKAAELLRDRALAEWRREQERRERVELDEIGARGAPGWDDGKAGEE